MLLRNWYNSLAVSMGRKTMPNGHKNSSGSVRDVSYYQNGKTNAFCPEELTIRMSDFWTSSGCIIIGSGTTPPTVDDYKLESQITSGITGSIASKFSDEGLLVFTLTLNNTSSADITIGEVGYAAGVPTSSSSSGAAALLERTVLDEPITIPAGGVGQILYTFGLEFKPVA